jgi:hypothetical protein
LEPTIASLIQTHKIKTRTGTQTQGIRPREIGYAEGYEIIVYIFIISPKFMPFFIPESGI